MAFFAARQPILDKDKKLVAYELLFRESLKNVFPDIGEDIATSKIIEGLQFNLGLDTLTENKLAFINFTQETLLQRYPLMLPKEQLVVEILESVPPTRQLLEVCKEFKEKGYQIALDDYVHKNVWLHFFPYVDIIKVDLRDSTPEQVEEIRKAAAPFPSIKLLAEKVETHEEFHQAIEMGFSYFQGYFFSKPEVMRSRTLDPSQLTIAQLMTELASDEPDTQAISKVFETDVNLSFKLLRYAQSPLFKRRNDIVNIKQAIIALGLQELRRFVSLLFTAQFSDRKPAALTVMSLVRARFCEHLSAQPGQHSSEAGAFLTGMLSLLDGLLDASLPELLDKLPLSPPIKAALIEGEGRLADYLLMAKAFEAADWPSAQQLCKQLELSIDKVTRLYVDSVRWATVRENMG
ncbi:EAL and HDOD domain-containing protein [Bowmanella yangjiangensis]|uniref:HDOD domain-containing protein n=1 Tax=Bowmanella yangjiangensis TaxID=2811230 RepID=A0ABS3CRB5_9ALTE|nr:HDOD domain-containing protein [Bowmanella yangjiangensis]MBN7818981.1 HDOD domain-containing protein [Bowmanella yangjiangensis]